MQSKPNISVLVASRKNSKFLAKFLHALVHYTGDINQIEVLVSYSQEDTWNRELIANYEEFFHFFPENYGYGRQGLHIYFNELLEHATGDWVIYFCDDHCIVRKHWDMYLMDCIKDNHLSPEMIYSIVPKFDNTGAMNQMFSRGYVKAMGNIGRFGNIDSYNNFVAEVLPESKKFYTGESLFHDFTADPEVMTDLDTKLNVVSSKEFHMWGSEPINMLIQEDRERLKEAIKHELQG